MGNVCRIEIILKIGYACRTKIILRVNVTYGFIYRVCKKTWVARCLAIYPEVNRQTTHENKTRHFVTK